jgi:hypothetical protein
MVTGIGVGDGVAVVVGGVVAVGLPGAAVTLGGVVAVGAVVGVGVGGSGVVVVSV